MTDYTVTVPAIVVDGEDGKQTTHRRGDVLENLPSDQAQVLVKMGSIREVPAAEATPEEPLKDTDTPAAADEPEVTELEETGTDTWTGTAT